MVAALIMGAAIRPRPVFVKMYYGHSGMVRLNSGLPEYNIIIVQVGNGRLGWTRAQMCNRTSGNLPLHPLHRGFALTRGPE
jgi:hypothetical protein